MIGSLHVDAATDNEDNQATVRDVLIDISRLEAENERLNRQLDAGRFKAREAGKERLVEIAHHEVVLGQTKGYQTRS